MKHLGDICQINGAEIAPVDVVVGGSPCQDLSVAGRQTGLAGGHKHADSQNVGRSGWRAFRLVYGADKNN